MTQNILCIFLANFREVTQNILSAFLAGKCFRWSKYRGLTLGRPSLKNISKWLRGGGIHPPFYFAIQQNLRTSLIQLIDKLKLVGIVVYFLPNINMKLFREMGPIWKWKLVSLNFAKSYEFREICISRVVKHFQKYFPAI